MRAQASIRDGLGDGLGDGLLKVRCGEADMKGIFEAHGDSVRTARDQNRDANQLTFTQGPSRRGCRPKNDIRN